MQNRGFGFVSFGDIKDYIRAMKEMNGIFKNSSKILLPFACPFFTELSLPAFLPGKYIGNRPIHMRKSDWKERNLDEAKKNGTYMKNPYARKR